MVDTALGRPASAQDDDVMAAVLASLGRLLQAASRLRQVVAVREGMAMSDTLVLSSLGALRGPVTPRALADTLMVSSGTMTAVLDRLEHAGYVERTANPDDRRSLLVRLTDEGRTIYAAAMSDCNDFVARALLDLGVSVELPAALDRISTGIQQYVASAHGDHRSRPS